MLDYDKLCAELLSSLEVPKPGEMDCVDSKNDMALRFTCSEMILQIKHSLASKRGMSSLSVPDEGWQYWFGVRNGWLIERILQYE